MSWRTLQKLRTVRSLLAQFEGSARYQLCNFSTYRQPIRVLPLGLISSRSKLSPFGCLIVPSAALSTEQQRQQNTSNKELSQQEEDPFDPLTDRIPEKPVTVAEGASYGLIILAGLAVAATAAYAVFKELIFEPKEYKIFGKALDRVKHDSQVTIRLGSPITGYGQETRSRNARQRISNRVWKDENGVERIEVVFLIRGPQGAGKVHCEMFKDKMEKAWKFTYLIVDIMSPTPTRIMLESYVPS